MGDGLKSFAAYQDESWRLFLKGLRDGMRQQSGMSVEELLLARIQAADAEIKQLRVELAETHAMRKQARQDYKTLKATPCLLHDDEIKRLRALQAKWLDAADENIERVHHATFTRAAEIVPESPDMRSDPRFFDDKFHDGWDAGVSAFRTAIEAERDGHG